jgi:superfamily II DNA or RNA helicase
MSLRHYQLGAIQSVRAAWQSDHHAVCLVAPTGSGKTAMGVELCRDVKVLWLVHTRELLRQSLERLRDAGLDATVIGPGYHTNPYASAYVATVQTLLARDLRPEVDVVVLDECHHYAAQDWSELPEHYRSTRVVGLTATPERRDGTPLGDIFDHLVVAAHYSELLRDGYLVPCDVYQPSEILQGGIAQHPVDAWSKLTPGAQTFLFAPRIKLAHKYADEFSAANVSAAVISQRTPRAERQASLDAFRDGTISVLSNVYALTEGVDVPEASSAILARGCTHVSPYLQMVGRILRPAEGKTRATLIDLTGATHLHGLPTEDRIYSLEGEGIKRATPGALKNCPKCGVTINAFYMICPQCGHVFVARELKHRIYSVELRAVFAGEATPDEFKNREYKRLRQLAADKNWSIGWVIGEYRKLFGAAPELRDVTDADMARELAKLRGIQSARGYKPGFVAVRFKSIFGRWPPRHL